MRIGRQRDGDRTTDATRCAAAPTVPAAAALDKVQTYLASASGKGLLDYEEAILRQE